MLHAETAHKMIPVNSVIANINIAPTGFEYTPIRLRIFPRHFVKAFSAGYPYVFWLGLLFLAFVPGTLFATAIVVRRSENQTITIAADSRAIPLIKTSSGSIVYGKPIDTVCKICQLKNGVFALAGDDDFSWCEIATQIANQFAKMSERASEFTTRATKLLTESLKTAPPGKVAYYASEDRDIVEATFIGTEAGTPTYAVAILRAAIKNGVPDVATVVIEACPARCRPYFALGSGAARTYMDTNRVALLPLSPTDFVMKVITETAKIDKIVGGKVTVGSIGPFGFNLTRPGACPSDNNRQNGK